MVTTLLQLNMALKHQIKTNSFSGNIVFVRLVTRLLCPTMDCFCHTLFTRFTSWFCIDTSVGKIQNLHPSVGHLMLGN
jgi:hypothetical protein